MTSINNFLANGEQEVSDVITAARSVVKNVPKLSPIQESIDNQLEEGEKTTAPDPAKFLAHMEKLKKMGVHESTFWKKWVEVKDYRNQAALSSSVKAKIWRPKNITNLKDTIEEIKNLQPRIFYVEPDRKSDMDDWLMIRVFCHTMEYEQTPGRFLRFLVVDDTSGQYLGAASLSNDVMALTCRDTFIGWSAKARIGTVGSNGERTGKLIYSAIGSCIMGTQPFGYNFLGGKLVASLILSKTVRDTWEEVVKHKLVGMTTTSLYGPNSMYCGIPYWQGCGTSMGKIALKPDDSFYNEWHATIKRKHAAKYAKKIAKIDPDKGPITGIKQRILDMIFKEVGSSSSKYHHGFERGVYYSPFYEETKKFLSDEKDFVPEKWTLIKRFETDAVGMINWWREKAIKRYSKLHAEGRLKPEILFYNKMMDLDYETAKREYLTEVGR